MGASAGWGPDSPGAVFAKQCRGVDVFVNRHNVSAVEAADLGILLLCPSVSAAYCRRQIAVVFQGHFPPRADLLPKEDL